jgi:hypothetical protein
VDLLCSGLGMQEREDCREFPLAHQLRPFAGRTHDSVRSGPDASPLATAQDGSVDGRRCQDSDHIAA